MADEKKIIIDEDWKSQVQAEQEQAKKESAPGPQAERGAPSQMGDMPMPPASFEMLITTLATEALVSLGQIPHPATNEPQVHRNQAKYLIDTIDLLKEKTRGNLTPEEQQMLDAILYQLKMVFVESAGSGEAGDVSPPVDHLA